MTGTPVETALAFLAANSTAQKYLAFLDRFGDGSSLAPLHAPVDTTGVRIDPATAQRQDAAALLLQAIAAALAGTAWVDRSGTTSSTAAAFTPLAAANTTRRALRISNLSPSATLYLYDKAGGTASTTNAMPVPPNGIVVLDKPSTAALQIAASAASIAYEAAEG